MNSPENKKLKEEVDRLRSIVENLKKSFPTEMRTTIQKYMQSRAFTDRKLTDTPTDDFSVINRKYANLNGTVANRPNASVAVVGQHYFATDTSIPMRYKGSNTWVNGVGSVVA